MNLRQEFKRQTGRRAVDTISLSQTNEGVIEEVKYTQAYAYWLETRIDQLTPPQEEQKSKEHVCGLMGYNPMKGDVCEACEERNAPQEVKGLDLAKLEKKLDEALERDFPEVKGVEDQEREYNELKKDAELFRMMSSFQNPVQLMVRFHLYIKTKESERVNQKRSEGCKYVKREGESCTLNENCTYPDCPTR